MTLRSLLLATDFSKHADYALERAVQIAKAQQAVLEGLHVIRQGWFSSFFSHEDVEKSDNVSGEKREADKAFAERMQKYAFDQVGNLTTLEGKVTDSILAYLKDKSTVDLVVMGAYGRFFINDYVLGTTAQRMAKHSPVPLLLVKKKPAKPYQRIMVAVDFSSISQRIVEVAYQLFPDAQFQLIHVADIWYEKIREKQRSVKRFEAMPHPMLDNMYKKMETFLANCAVNSTQFETKLVGGYPADTISELAKASEMELLVFGTMGYTDLHYLLIGSVAQRILNLGPCDMLLVPPVKQ